jgi:hypothetical protein
MQGYFTEKYGKKVDFAKFESRVKKKLIFLGENNFCSFRNKCFRFIDKAKLV